jgi:hypothetical protein
MSLRAKWPAVGSLIVGVVVLVVVAVPRGARAQTSLVVGQVPDEGVALLFTAADATPEELRVELLGAGCAPTTIAVTETGAWLSYVPDAPAFVNASFPATLESGRGFVVRCQPSAAGQSFVHLEASGTGTGSATLSDARAGGHAGFDRFVVEFDDEVVPGYQIEYVTTPQFTCGAGFEVTPPGNAWLRITLEPARINDDEGQLTIPSRSLDPNLPALIAAEEICGFEGQVIWLLGLDEQQPFQLQLLSNPARLVVDVPHEAVAPTSGVSGVAFAGPQCPVIIQGQPCPDLPVSVGLSFKQAGVIAGTVTTGPDGQFALDLAPGTYEVTSTGAVLPSLPPQEVTVPTGSHAWLELRLDTGIR